MLEEKSIYISHVQIGDELFYLSCVKEIIQPLNLFNQLSKSEILPKIYWKHRDDAVEYAAFGQLLELPSLPLIKTIEAIQGPPLNPLLFGGSSYSEGAPHWKNKFPAKRFILPKYLIEQSKEGTFLKTFSLSDKPKEIPFKLFTNSPLKEAPLSIIKREDSPSQETWNKHVNTVLKLFKETSLQKAVLARQTTLTLDQPLNPYLLLEFLKETQQNCSFFSFQFDAETLFLGATPECLYSRIERSIFTEALAGTSLELQKKPLTDSKKDVSEFTFVTDYLNNTLKKLCDSIQQKPRTILSTGFLKHINAHFTGKLKKAVADLAIIQALHPTPAVCGTPKMLAYKKLLELDPFDRGWYAAPIGKVTEDSAQFLVGIRSALVHINTIDLFSGCGIVEGSDPTKEWDELENKIFSYLNFLNQYVRA